MWRSWVEMGFSSNEILVTLQLQPRFWWVSQERLWGSRRQPMLVKVECDCFSCTLWGATHCAAVDNQSNRFGEEPERAMWSHSESCGFPSLRAPGEKKKTQPTWLYFPSAGPCQRRQKGSLMRYICSGSRGQDQAEKGDGSRRYTQLKERMNPLSLTFQHKHPLLLTQLKFPHHPAPTPHCFPFTQR